MKPIVTGRCGHKGSDRVSERLAHGHEVVATYQSGGLKDQDREYNLRWMQKVRP